MKDRLVFTDILRSNRKPIKSIYLHDKNTLYSGSTDGEFVVWDLRQGRSVQTKQFEDPILSIHEKNDIYVYANGTIFLLDSSLKSNREISLGEKNDISNFCGVAIRKSLICVPFSNGPGLYCENQKNYISTFNQTRGHIMCISEGPNFIIGNEDGSVSVLNDTIDYIKLFNEPIFSVAYDNVVWAGSTTNKIFRLLISESNLYKSQILPPIIIEKEFIQTIEFCGDLAAVATVDGSVTIFEKDSISILTCLNYHKQNVNSIIFDNSSNIYLASNDGSISCWPLY
ncbi:hypothetical protein A3Q56_03802 [Intoshia linei]|uniref:Uncharacterized protein n=1 Tax=Intoshia linei TaxID=1819745 RepID=A0A177B2E8_9BILA|nr:hypothetical protein A3Q56_03802 [Intoshia linei]